VPYDAKRSTIQRLVEDLTAFVDRLGLDRFRAVGFSLGGNAACAYAALHPDRVERLVPVECFTEGCQPEAVAHLDDPTGFLAAVSAFLTG
jgi:pimeloyl-ACP methyl ester carboxylesterase